MHSRVNNIPCASPFCFLFICFFFRIINGSETSVSDESPNYTPVRTPKVFNDRIKYDSTTRVENKNKNPDRVRRNQIPYLDLITLNPTNHKRSYSNHHQFTLFSLSSLFINPRFHYTPSSAVSNRSRPPPLLLREVTAIVFGFIEDPRVPTSV